MDPQAGGTQGEAQVASTRTETARNDELGKEIELKVVTQELLRSRQQW